MAQVRPQPYVQETRYKPRAIQRHYLSYMQEAAGEGNSRTDSEGCGLVFRPQQSQETAEPGVLVLHASFSESTADIGMSLLHMAVVRAPDSGQPPSLHLYVQS
jgi:hypothetical protein